MAALPNRHKQVPCHIARCPSICSAGLKTARGYQRDLPSWLRFRRDAMKCGCGQLQSNIFGTWMLGRNLDKSNKMFMMLSLTFASVPKRHSSRSRFRVRGRCISLKAARNGPVTVNIEQSSAVLLVVFLLFLPIGLDVLSGANLVGSADNSIHNLVLENISVDDRKGFDKLSDAVITAGYLASVPVSLALANRGRWIPGLATFAGIPAVFLLVQHTKDFFHRMRPSDLRDGFSFPSGHTSQFGYAIAMFICVLLPRLSPSLVPSWLTLPKERSGAISTLVWFAMIPLAVAIMGSTRMLADVHWLSDTVAGAAVGVGSAAAIEVLIQVAGDSQESDPAIPEN